MVTTTMEFKILDVFTPSEKQKSAGIHGTVNFEIVNDGATLVRLSGATLRQSKDGNFFLSEPSFSIGQGSDQKWLKHYQIYPGTGDESNQAQRSSRDSLTEEVVRILQQGGTRRQNNGGSAPQQSSPAPTASAPNDPWA